MLDTMCYYSDELHCLKVKAQVSGVQPTVLFQLTVQGTLVSTASVFPTCKNVNKKLLNTDVSTSIALAFASLHRS